ncbi:hypothetical protein JXL83_04090 [candidate division WOR-3 bacterium]|nr:hypothetical protein [candidate division WOR-3 bacterium]
MMNAVKTLLLLSLVPAVLIGNGWSLHLFHFPEEIIISSDTSVTLAMGTVVNITGTETENKGMTVDIQWGDVYDNFEFFTVFECEGEYFQTSPYQVSPSLPDKKVSDIMTPETMPGLPPCIDREEAD